MADTEDLTSPAPAIDIAAPAKGDRSNDRRAKPSAVPLHKLYALPVPIRTFPLPNFYPGNPVSLIHVLYTWLSHAMWPPPPEPSVVYTGVWCPQTRSVNIMDSEEMTALWQQGFFGKGSLSRSEPNWMKGQLIRSGEVRGTVSEHATMSRREERMAAKWERARTEQEAVEAQRRDEASQLSLGEAKGVIPGYLPAAPVGPSELLALPNSFDDAVCFTRNKLPSGIHASHLGSHGHTSRQWLVNGDNREVDLTNSRWYAVANETMASSDEGKIGSDLELKNQSKVERTLSRDGANGSSREVALPTPENEIAGNRASRDDGSRSLKRQKSVRFSTEVQSTTFQHTDPPSPNHALNPRSANGSAANGHLPANDKGSSVKREELGTAAAAGMAGTAAVSNKEHLQLSPEEAFFLTFAIGALRIVELSTHEVLSVQEILHLFRAYSHFPPRTSPHDLRPDDNFLLHYVVYHHFRSLGWIPRHGVKFGVDWLLYKRGPVFDHAEFGVIVLPAYSDPWWRAHGHEAQRKTWHWLHGVNRVLSHVMKSLVLVYVDVPAPSTFQDILGRTGKDGGFLAAMKHYTIREILVRRWSSNRNR